MRANRASWERETDAALEACRDHANGSNTKSTAPTCAESRDEGMEAGREAHGYASSLTTMSRGSQPSHLVAGWGRDEDPFLDESCHPNHFYS